MAPRIWQPATSGVHAVSGTPVPVRGRRQQLQSSLLHLSLCPLRPLPASDSLPSRGALGVRASAGSSSPSAFSDGASPGLRTTSFPGQQAQVPGSLPGSKNAAYRTEAMVTQDISPRESASLATGNGAGGTRERLLLPVQRVFAEAEAQGSPLASLRALGEPASGTPGARAGQQRKTKIVCTIGPTSNTREMIWKLAEAGMNVARLNMSHGDHASHLRVIDLVRDYNRHQMAANCTSDAQVLGIMLDTKGPEVRSGDLPQPILLEKEDQFTFTIRRGVGTQEAVSVNYDGFIHDVDVGDTVLVDGGLLALLAEEKTETDVRCRVIDGGEFKSRRHLNVRGKSATLPSITEKDWEDIRFGVEHQVDYYALSFVKDAQVVWELKEYLRSEGADIQVISKIESADSVPNLRSILEASDGAMVARGDLGAELAVEEVPLLQDEIIRISRSMGKPVIVATNMLESMINHPAPTRAEVSDIAIAVREGTDAIMLSGETAHGKYPLKAVKVMATVALETEATMPQPSFRPSNSTLSMGAAFQNNMSEMFAFHATMMANTLGASVLVFTRSGFMATLLSHYRPQGCTFAFTNDKRVQQRLALYHGVRAMYLPFSSDAEETFSQAIALLLRRGMVKVGEDVALVQSGRQPIWRSESTHHIQVRRVQPPGP